MLPLVLMPTNPLQAGCYTDPDKQELGLTGDAVDHSSIAFWYSVVSGVVAAVLLGTFNWIVREIWRHRVSPWWENMAYSDARVDGEWETKLTTEMDSDYREIARVQQVGHSVVGTIECISGVDRGNKYEFSGSIRNTILSAHYWNTDKTALDSGSFTLRLECNGERLAGFTSYYFDNDHSLKSREYCWTRCHKLPNALKVKCDA